MKEQIKITNEIPHTLVPFIDQQTGWLDDKAVTRAYVYGQLDKGDYFEAIRISTEQLQQNWLSPKKT